MTWYLVVFDPGFGSYLTKQLIFCIQFCNFFNEWLTDDLILVGVFTNNWYFFLASLTSFGSYSTKQLSIGFFTKRMLNW